MIRVHKAPGLRSIFHTFGRRQGAFPEKTNGILRENQTFAAYYAMGIANSQQRRNAHEISRFPVLTVLLLALSLTACGKEPAKNDRNDAGSGQNSAYDAVSDPNRNNAPNNDAIIGRDDNTVTAPDTNPAPNPANDPAGDLPGASMDRMLRNGRVHDRDGDLLDGENSVTPGADR